MESLKSLDIDKLVESLRSYNPQKVILFGSYARGDFHCGSDIDILIIKDTDKKFTDRIGEVLELCVDIPNMEPIVYTPKEFANMINENNNFIKTVLDEGVVIYEQ